MDKNRNAHLVGVVVPSGYVHPRWLFVTRVDGDTVYGRRWSARAQRWTKTETWCMRDALWKRIPRCPKPARPTERSETVGALRLACHIDGDWFVLSGSPTGQHRLWRGATPKRRLDAHWEGYVEAAARAVSHATPGAASPV